MLDKFDERRLGSQTFSGLCTCMYLRIQVSLLPHRDRAMSALLEQREPWEPSTGAKKEQTNVGQGTKSK